MGTVTNIKIGPMEVKWSASSLGFTEAEAIELNPIEDKVEVKAHQEGSNILTHIRTGKAFEISLTLKETNETLINYILQNSSAQAGTASGGSADQMLFGSGRDFTQTLGQSAALNLHPVVNAASNYNEDWHFWKAYPQVDNFTFNGEEANTWTISFLIYPDTSKAASARLGVFGDWNTGDFSSVS